MNKRINFEDNIFILLMRLRIIRDTITLDADPEIFLEKILDDINFTDRVLRILLDYLRENDRLMARDDLLDQVSDIEWQFSQLLRDFLDHEGNISVRNIPSITEKLTLLRNGSLDRRKTAQNLSQSAENRTDNSVVSSDEISELLKAF